MKKTEIEIMVTHIRREKLIVDSMPEESIKINLADFIEDNDLDFTFDELYKEFRKQRLAKSMRGLK